MFDDLSLDDLVLFRKKLAMSLLQGNGVVSFSMPDGVSASMDFSERRRLLSLINAAIESRLGGESPTNDLGGRMLPIHVVGQTGWRSF